MTTDTPAENNSVEKSAEETPKEMQVNFSEPLPPEAEPAPLENEVDKNPNPDVQATQDKGNSKEENPVVAATPDNVPDNSVTPEIVTRNETTITDTQDAYQADAKAAPESEQVGGTAANPNDVNTRPNYATEPYKESEDFVPNPAHVYGFLDTTGAGTHEDPAGQVSPILGKDESVFKALPEADQKRVRNDNAEFAADGSKIIRPDVVVKPAGS
jgi:hypothetical protein